MRRSRRTSSSVFGRTIAGRSYSNGLRFEYIRNQVLKMSRVELSKFLNIPEPTIYAWGAQRRGVPLEISAILEALTANKITVERMGELIKTFGTPKSAYDELRKTGKISTIFVNRIKRWSSDPK